MTYLQIFESPTINNSVFPLPLAFSLSFARGSIIAAEISLLQSMKLLRARLYAQVFSDHSPSLSLMSLVLFHHDFNRLAGYLADPKPYS